MKESFVAERGVNSKEVVLGKLVAELSDNPVPFTEMGEIEQAAALSVLMFHPEVKTDIDKADLVAEELARLEMRLYGYLKTKHETAGIPA